MKEQKYKYRTNLHVDPALALVFTTGTISRLCCVAARTVSKWIDSGALKGYRIPGSEDRRVDRRDLAAFLKIHGMTDALAKLGDQKVVLIAGACAFFQADTRATLGASADCRVALDLFELGVQASSLGPSVRLAVLDSSLGKSTLLSVVGRLRQACPHAALAVLTYEDDPGPGGWTEFDLTLPPPHDPAPLVDLLQGGRNGRA